MTGGPCTTQQKKGMQSLNAARNGQKRTDEGKEMERSDEMLEKIAVVRSPFRAVADSIADWIRTCWIDDRVFVGQGEEMGGSCVREGR